MKSDIAIAQEAELHPIADVAASLGLSDSDLELYGKYKAKIDARAVLERSGGPRGKLILVTALTPTPAGEGKTTVTVGLGDALRRLNKRSVVALREPSLGPVFGMKGGAAGGGYAQVVPMEDINLHFTGDIHAVTAANNLLAALLDNHLHQGNALGLDPRRITWKRCLDINDRQLRGIVGGLGGRANGVPREDGFDISVASEVMAVLCLASDIADLKERLGRIVVGRSMTGAAVAARDLGAQGAMTALLRDALKPNLTQTLEHTPALIHGGPFANIAHGCNSLAATRLGLALGDYVVTEAGFGADLGAEKFFDIKCRLSGLAPDAVVLVATVRALKHHGGAAKGALGQEDMDKLSKGMPNLLRHAENIQTVYRLPVTVAINRFPTDTDREISFVENACRALSVSAWPVDVWGRGGEGALALAQEVIRLCTQPNAFSFCYEDADSFLEKLTKITRRVYRGDDVAFSPTAKKQLLDLTSLGFGHLPVCVAKTQYSFSDNPALLGAPEHFTLHVNQLRVSAGAGFIVALTGDVMTMPGLPKKPSAESIDVDDTGRITGLF